MACGAVTTTGLVFCYIYRHYKIHNCILGRGEAIVPGKGKKIMNDSKKGAGKNRKVKEMCTPKFLNCVTQKTEKIPHWTQFPPHVIPIEYNPSRLDQIPLPLSLILFSGFCPKRTVSKIDA